MRKLFYLTLILTFITGCTSNNDPLPDNGNGDDPVKNISNFTATISSPIQTRDYSYHDQGYDGIFENPYDDKTFSGYINITYNNNSIELSASQIEVTWRSSIDGILFQGNPNDNLESEISKSLTKGNHTIFLEASIPSENLMVKDSILLSNQIKLTAINTGKSVKLNWTKYEGNDFVSYSIYKENSDPIIEIQDINTIEFEDTQFSSFIEDYEYQVVVNTTENYTHPIGSNIVSMHPGIFIEFPYYVYKLIKDPIRSKIYAIVRPQSNSNESDKYGILIIDNGSNTFEINSHILEDHRFADLDISPDGQYLFLCQERVEKITKLNLDTLEATTFVTNTNGWGIHKIEVGNNNVLYCHRDPPTSGSTGFYLYDGNNGNFISTSTDALSHGDIEINNTNNTIYAGESNTSNGRMYTFLVDQNSINIDANYPVWPNGVSFPTPFILLSDDNQNVFWEHFQLDANLNVIRTFDTDIKACSPNNIYLSDFNKLYNFNDMSIVYEYPELPPTENTSMVFMDDNTLIFCRAYNTNVNQEEYTYFFKLNIE
ncbi:hypothetical protein [Tenacibaculum sp. 190524A05c]|uniref:hypothetical protein n=1 Tax=Tenacibaculum platacis TaxID=3137852 RepID=UPI0032B2E869